MKSLLLTVGLLGAICLPATAAPPSAPWAVGNIGLANGVGQADVDVRGVWSIRAATIDAPFVLDSLFTISQPFDGDGSILALLLSQAGGNAEFGQAGVSFLEQPRPRSRAVHLHMTSGHGVAVGYRTIAGAAPVTETGDGRYGTRRFPIWLRLQREGDRFTPFSSVDGDAWTRLRAPLSIPAFPARGYAAITAASGQGEAVRALFSSPLIAPGLLSPHVDAFSGNGSVLLTWPPVRGAIGYQVRRGAPDQSVQSATILTPQPIRESSFVEDRVPTGKPIRYLVSALFPEGVAVTEGWATESTIVPAALPYGLISGDLNVEATQMRGSCLFNTATGVYRISGTGSAPGGFQDRCFIAARRLVDDLSTTVEIIDRPSRIHLASSAGIMVREDLVGDSRMLFLAVSAARGLSLYARTRASGEAIPVGPPIVADRDLRLPLTVRLRRRGSRFEVFLSEDGRTFRPAGTPVTFDPPLPPSLYGGYAITSANPGRASVGQFRNLSFSLTP